jgi:hypothetical protein
VGFKIFNDSSHIPAALSLSIVFLQEPIHVIYTSYREHLKIGLGQFIQRICNKRIAGFCVRQLIPNLSKGDNMTAQDVLICGVM